VDLETYRRLIDAKALEGDVDWLKRELLERLAVNTAIHAENDVLRRRQHLPPREILRHEDPPPIDQTLRDTVMAGVEVLRPFSVIYDARFQPDDDGEALVIEDRQGTTYAILLVPFPREG
jgi:hypothetical protein